MYWYAIVISSVVVFLSMPLFIRFMLKYRVLDKSGGRKIHKGEKVNMGGLVVFLGFLFAVATSFPSFDKEHFQEIICFLILFIVIIVVGVRDDQNSLTPKVKLVIEIIIGLFLCRLGLRIDSLYGFLGIDLIPSWISYSITVFFYVVVANAYNLIDGVDGQSAMQALSVFIFLLLFYIFVIPLDSGVGFGSSIFWIVITISMIGALLSYLHYNWEPSRVFMGDTGSLFIGFIIGILLIVAINYNGNLGADAQIFGHQIKSKLGVVVLLFFIPLADTLRVFSSRVLRRKGPFSPDKTHIHHLLLRTGDSHRTCTIITTIFSVIISITGIILSLFFDDNIFIPLIIVIYLLFVLALSLIIKYRVKRMN